MGTENNGTTDTETENPPPTEPGTLPAVLQELVLEAREVLVLFWQSPRGRDLRLASRAAGHTAMAAIATWLTAVAICLVTWLVSAPPASPISGPLHAGGELWLLAHHAALTVPEGRVAFAPLGFTVLVLLALHHAAPEPEPLSGPQPGPHADSQAGTRGTHLGALVLGAAAGYATTAAFIARTATTSDVHPDLAQAIILAACFGAAVPAVLHWRRVAALIELPAWMGDAVRAAALASAVLGAAAAALVAGMLIAHFPERGWPHDAADATGMFALVLALLPNALGWAVGYLAGPGFAIGTGTTVSVLRIDTGKRPAFPLLHAVPQSGAYPYSLAFLLVPLSAGVAAATILHRAGQTEGRTRQDQLRAAATATVATALGAVAVATLSGGSLAGGRMAAVGPSPWRTGAAVAALVGTALAAALTLPWLAQALRSLTIRGLLTVLTRPPTLLVSRLYRLTLQMARRTGQRLARVRVLPRVRRRVSRSPDASGTEVGIAVGTPQSDERGKSSEESSRQEQLGGPGNRPVSQREHPHEAPEREEHRPGDASPVPPESAHDRDPDPQPGPENPDGEPEEVDAVPGGDVLGLGVGAGEDVGLDAVHGGVRDDHREN